MNPNDSTPTASTQGTTTPTTPQRSDALSNLAVMAGLGAMEQVETPKVAYGANLNVVAMHLGQIIGRLDLFMQYGELVFFDWQGERQVMTGIRFRTWINGHVIIYEKRNKDTDAPVPMTLSIEAANTILQTQEFLRGVRPLRGMNVVRLPVVRRTGEMELLPFGYDEETGIFTVDTGIQYDQDMDMEAAKGWIDRTYGGFPLTDARSISVVVAGLLTLFVRHLPDGDSLKPGSLVRGNKPGCGKSVIAKSWQTPVLGRCPSVKMKQGEQLDKEMEAFAIAGKPCIFLDNVYGSLRNATLDQMLTSEESEGRAMGGHGLFCARNQAWIVVTANDIEGNDDAARRFLLVDLFQPEDIADQDVDPEKLLNDKVIKSPAWRARMLGVCWALVRNWFEKGMPKGAITLATFENYSWLLGGIVEAAGYVNPFTRPEVELSLNPEQAEFRDLMEGVLEEMEAATEKDFTLEDLARIARRKQIYEREVGTQDQGRKATIKEEKLDKQEAGYAEDRGYMNDSQRSMFGKKLKKRNGDHPVVKGRKLEFGKRYQARKSTFTVRVVS